LGSVSLDQGGHPVAHAVGSARQHPSSFLHVSDGKLHDVNVLDLLLPEPGAFSIMDRGYLDFERLYRLHEAKSFFVTRAKSNLKAQRRYSHPVDRSTALIGDQTIVLSGFYSRQDFDTPLRRVRFKDPDTGKRLVFLTINFILPAFTLTELYRCRWQVELFFKWIKQHLRIKVFFATSENAVKTQIWIAVSVYVLLAIVKKRLNLSASLYERLQILSLTRFERIPLDQLLNTIIADDIQAVSPNPLNLFN
jgi:IS4 transposase